MNFEYSLSENLEKKRKMKLKKIVFVNDPRRLPNSDVFIERVEIPYVLKELPIVNKEEILKLFDLERQAVYEK